jgi:uncharacterized protein YdeI (YjbR/CyaY-like superfamily)
MSTTKPPRTTLAPAPLAKAMKPNRAAKAAWDALAYSHKREYAEWITRAKKDETRVHLRAAVAQARNA